MTATAAMRFKLDANYNLRARVPWFQRHFDDYEAASAAFRAHARSRLDLAYGEGARRKVDLFLPQGPAGALLVFIHGGYWQSQDRRNFSFVAAPFVARGAAVAVVGYELAPAADMDAIVGDVRTAIVWLHRHAGELGFDRERVFIAGHSAGGHLAAVALANDWRAFALPPDVIKGVCAISGIFDLEPIRLCYLNDILNLSLDQARSLSPIHLAPQTRCPVLVTVGGNETEAFLEQSRAYVQALQKVGIAVELIVQPGLDHYEIIRAFGAADNIAVDLLCRHMGLDGAT